MTANLVLAASVGQGPDDILTAVLAAVMFVAVGGAVLAYMALRHTSRR